MRNIRVGVFQCQFDITKKKIGFQKAWIFKLVYFDHHLNARPHTPFIVDHYGADISPTVEQ